MRKVVLGINITADGYCGHENMVADAELHNYFTALLRDSSDIVFGRKTFELMVPYWPDIAKNLNEDEATNEFAQVFNSLNISVFSKTLKAASKKKLQVFNGDVAGIVTALKWKEGKNITIGSLSIASQLSAYDLIDEYHFVVHPILSGQGPRLFESSALRNNLPLTLIHTKSFSSGAVVLKYIRSK
ncbi:hypothetical protein TDB9533_03731 [Thalassocella blandensis]|nr:hypothetical protein TDB9533_03731 [Thalassocella blandensis]